MFKYFILIVCLIVSCWDQDRLGSYNLKGRSGKHITKVYFDTIKFKIPLLKFGNMNALKIPNTAWFGGREAFSISNFADQSIHIFDFRARDHLLAIQLYTEGPNTTINGKYGFYHQLLPDQTVLILDPPTKRLSRVDNRGTRIESHTIPPNPDFEYLAVVDWSIQGALHGDDFFYPVIPGGFMPLTIQDPQFKRLKHLFHYRVGEGFRPMIIDRNNFYTHERFYNFDECCMTNFLSLLKNDLLISDCVNPFVRIYEYGTGRLKDSIEMKSREFDQVPAYDQPVTAGAYQHMPANLYREILEFGHTHPSYYQLHVDTTHHLIIRQAKLGMTDEEYMDNRFYWSHSFILSDTDHFQYRGEAIVKRGDYKNISFLNGVKTSEGLYFPFFDPQGMEEDHLYFLRARFIE